MISDVIEWSLLVMILGVLVLVYLDLNKFHKTLAKHAASTTQVCERRDEPPAAQPAKEADNACAPIDFSKIQSLTKGQKVNF